MREAHAGDEVILMRRTTPVAQNGLDRAEPEATEVNAARARMPSPLPAGSQRYN
jgi:hypothetical protein